jgi:hypothetical protein
MSGVFFASIYLNVCSSSRLTIHNAVEEAITANLTVSKNGPEGGHMISSPCKTCPNADLPKEMCLATCEKLHGVQEILLKMPIQVYSAVDASDSNRYRLSLTLSMPTCE